MRAYKNFRVNLEQAFLSYIGVSILLKDRLPQITISHTEAVLEVALTPVFENAEFYSLPDSVQNSIKFAWLRLCCVSHRKNVFGWWIVCFYFLLRFFVLSNLKSYIMPKNNFFIINIMHILFLINSPLNGIRFIISTVDIATKNVDHLYREIHRSMRSSWPGIISTYEGSMYQSPTIFSEIASVKLFTLSVRLFSNW